MPTLYVLASAPGNNSGSDWLNALTSFPSGVRGNTYYVGGGAYAGRTFNTATSGSSLITFKKATVADHGTDTGWFDSYGTAPATFSSQLLFSTGYYTLDGQTRSADWESGYGFQINEPANTFGTLRLSSGASNVTLKYVDFEGGGLGDPAVIGSSVYCFGADVVDDLLIQNCKTANLWPDVFTIKGTNVTIEGCFIDENFSTPSLHGQIVADHGSNNVVFRNNKVRNPWGTAVYTVIGNGQTMDGLKIYGNIIWAEVAQVSPNGISAFVEVIQTATVNNAAVHHNTLVNIGYNPRITHVDNTGSNRLAYNNLWYNCGPGETVSHVNWTVDYSWYRLTTHDAETHEQAGSADPFVGAALENFRLTTETDPGLALSSEFETDLLGQTRSDWTRGALEFNAMADLLLLNQTANTDPVTELFRRCPGTSGILSDVVIHHSGAYPLHPPNGFSYAKHGTPQKYQYTFPGTLSLASARASRNVLT